MHSPSQVPAVKSQILVGCCLCMFWDGSCDFCPLRNWIIRSPGRQYWYLGVGRTRRECLEEKYALCRSNSPSGIWVPFSPLLNLNFLETLSFLHFLDRPPPLFLQDAGWGMVLLLPLPPGLLNCLPTPPSSTLPPHPPSGSHRLLHLGSVILRAGDVSWETDLDSPPTDLWTILSAPSSLYENHCCLNQQGGFCCLQLNLYWTLASLPMW